MKISTCLKLTISQTALSLKQIHVQHLPSNLICSTYQVFIFVIKIIPSVYIQAYNQGRVQRGRCTPLSHISIQIIKSSNHPVYCNVCMLCLNNSLLKLFPQTNQIKPSLKYICPGVRFSVHCIL